MTALVVIELFDPSLWLSLVFLTSSWIVERKQFHCPVSLCINYPLYFMVEMDINLFAWYFNMIGLLTQIIITSYSFKNVLRYFCKVWCKSNLCILWFDCSIALYLFTPLPHNENFLIVKHSCSREELSDVVFFPDTTSTNHCSRTYFWRVWTCASYLWSVQLSNWHFPSFTYHYLYVYITISKPLNCSPISAVKNVQRFQCQIRIFDNPQKRRCSHFRFPFTIESSGNFVWCRVTEAHIPLLLVGPFPI